MYLIYLYPSRSLFGLGPRGDWPLPNTECPLKSGVVVALVVVVVIVEVAATTTAAGSGGGTARTGADTTLDLVDITDIGEDRLNLYIQIIIFN